MTTPSVENDRELVFLKNRLKHTLEEMLKTAHDELWPSVAPLLPRANADTEQTLCRLIVRCMLGSLGNDLDDNSHDSKLKRKIHKNIQNLKHLLNETHPLVKKIAGSVALARISAKNSKINSTSETSDLVFTPKQIFSTQVLQDEMDATAENALIQLHTLLDEFEDATKEPQQTIETKRKPGAPRKTQIDEFLVSLRKIWKEAGPKTEYANPPSGVKNTTEFVDFLMAINEFLKPDHQLANSRAALIQRLNRGTHT